MLGDCVDERLSLGVLLLGMGLENWSKCPVAAARHFCGVFLWKNGSLGQLGGRRFLSFWWFTSFRFVRAGQEGVLGRDYGLEFRGGMKL